MPEVKPIEIVAGAEPVKLGSFLFTIVDPHPGYEVAYNRWYERDHLYSGCMIGPYNFAARRFVATADIKRLRDPALTEVTGTAHRGSYLALYWILAGYGDTWGRWAGQQVMSLHKAGRMFAERDHVHTALYDFCWEASRDPDGVPAELALDHPYNGLVAEWIDRSGDVDDPGFDRWLTAEHLPALLGGSDAGLVVGARPQPMRASAPGVQSREAAEGRVMLLWFLESEPSVVWNLLAKHREALEAQGRGRIVAQLPFIPTLPGTDRYADQLWLDNQIQ